VTARQFDRATYGPRVAEISAQLGTPFMPWQSDTAAGALEIDPVTGLLVYRTVIVTVPRQSGKTKQELAVAVHRALGFGGDQKINYTAQTRLKAREKWEDDHLKTLHKSPFRSMFRVRKTLGMEAILWNNGSQYGIESTTEKAGHGDTLDLGFIDEAFSQKDARIEQAFKPAMMTRPQPQLWIVSTAGTAASVYLRGKVDRGRLRCEMGLTRGVYYVEYSAPDDADPGDPATWRACMPALGHTVTEEAVQADFDSMDLEEFRRAYLNQWPDAAPPGWSVIAAEDWMSLSDPVSEWVRPVALAAAFAGDKRAAAIGAAARRADGLFHVELVDYRPGTSWCAPRLAELTRKYGPCAVVVDAGSHEGSMIAELDEAKVEVVSPTPREIAQAFGQFYELVTDSKNLRHRGEPELTSAVQFAVARDIGDAGRTWGRKASSVDISPVVAVTSALHGFMARGLHTVPPPNIF
jgi:phage terminase large subunit-like protein